MDKRAFAQLLGVSNSQIMDALALDAHDQAELVRSGQISPIELVEQAIARIEQINPVLNAVIHPLFEKARAIANSSLPDGPFRGVPIVIKDSDAASAGDPSHHGNKLLKEIDWHEDQDAFTITKLRSAGFMIVGKTNAPEFGLVPTTEPEAYGPTHNPWNLNYSPGGSSGGSAAAVASGMVAVGGAADGGGSIRIPASACGLVGLKPSRGRVSFGPSASESWAGLVVRHALTRSVRDSAAVLDVLAGFIPGDPYTAPTPARPFAQEVGADPGKLRIGIRTSALGNILPVDSECVKATEETGKLLASLGHTIEESSPSGLDQPDSLTNFMEAFHAFTAFSVRNLAEKVGREITKDDVEPLTWERTLIGRKITAIELLAALQAFQSWSRQVAQWWTNGWDLLLTPTLAKLPSVLGDLVPDPQNPSATAVKNLPYGIFTVPWNISGQPAISLPLAMSESGLPIGIQLVAAYGREDLLIRISAQLEQANPWKDRKPDDLTIPR